MNHVQPVRNENTYGHVAPSHSDLLRDVSRTFALTIPTLPQPLRRTVENAYLLCRIVDVIEDEPALDPHWKSALSRRFVDVVKGHREASGFERELSAALTPATPCTEKELVRNLGSVVAVTQRLSDNQKRPIEKCVSIMATGMMEFQNARLGGKGLTDHAHLDRYCYCVAGVVGEMLTELFCDYSPEIKQKHDALQKLSVSFGQGLQMTNILKDIWEDRQAGRCWLPRDVFLDKGFDPGTITPGMADPRFIAGLRELIASAFSHLQNARDYTLLIPAHETGIRQFCFWALSMAVLTIKNIHSHPTFIDASGVKISRRHVKLAMTTTRLSARSNLGLRIIFRIMSQGLSSQKRARRLFPWDSDLCLIDPLQPRYHLGFLFKHRRPHTFHVPCTANFGKSMT